MPFFNYNAIDQDGKRTEGQVEAINVEVAISTLQKRGLTISSIESDEEQKKFGLFSDIKIFQRISNRDIVILSRQISTLFEAQVSALRIFKLIASETQNPLLRELMQEVAADLQGGSLISQALEKHPRVFSPFYVNMVRSGEESGKLDQTFEYLADYLDRTYEVTSKARNALIYPIFVLFTFVVVMYLMMTLVIPRITSIIVESGQEIPIYTKIVIGTSNFLVDFGLWIIVVVGIAIVLFWRYVKKTDDGKIAWSQFKLNIPYVGDLYRKLYLSRIADNMNTMIISGIPMAQALEVTSKVVDDRIYRGIMAEALEAVRGGSSVSKAMSNHDEIPSIMVQMIKVGEETGELGKILATLAKFYRREVEMAVDALIGMIEPAMIVVLGIGVGILLTSILLPIYNITASF